MVRLFKVGMSQTLFADPRWHNPLLETLASGYIGQGEKVEEFEEALQGAMGLSQRPVTVNSCTSALDLALELIGVGPDDEVLTTPQTCTATNSPIVKRHAFPIWCDVTSQGLIDPRSVARNLVAHPDAKAIMVVDWAGQLPDFNALRKAAPGIPIIEDAAHRFGGEHYGDYVAWSFQAIKFLTTGDGGALLTPFNQLQRAKLLRWYGLDRESSASFRCAQNIQEVGFKYHMNDIAATIGLENLPLAQEHLDQHRLNAAYLSERLEIPFDPTSHYWFFPLTVSSHRDELIAYLAEKGIESSQVHARNDKHAGFHYPNGELPGVDWFDAHQIAVPCGWWLRKTELDDIAVALLAWK